MTQLGIYLIIMIMLLRTNDNVFVGACSFLSVSLHSVVRNLNLSAMDALDIAKDRYAANFEKVYYTQADEQQANRTEDTLLYYYKLPFADYYLVYEGFGESEKEYLIHLYEFVVDEPDTGIGHTVTYGWYIIDRETGLINAIK